ncbi:MAG: murein L,D-transpeptidase catalytic domain family protein [Zoogloeaceae bacterium]|nr:murein L,D-transpeptidase catalytic domain family protein [Zoogloeaceae bacterium]
MLKRIGRQLLAAGAVVAFSGPAPAVPTVAESIVADLASHAPGLDRQVLRHAVSAMHCALTHGAEPAQRLAVIDYSLPSSERRLWIFDLPTRRLLLADYVAHGNRSGDNQATRFSNVVGSHQSSLGLFRAAETYHGKHGYSLRMDGLESGVNDRARERAIVIHGADYVDPSWIARQGRIGRSQGCPAVRQEIVRTVVDTLKGGQFVFAYYPDLEWLQSSAFLNCDPSRVAAVFAKGREG